MLPFYRGNVETCQSGRLDFTANEGSGLNRTGGSNPPVSARVMCRDIVHTMSRHFLCPGALMCRVIVPLFWWMCQDIVPFFGLVVFGGVDGLGANDFSCCFVDGEGFGAVDEQDDALSVVGVADAEVA